MAAGLVRQGQIQVAYAIGVARPMNVAVYTEGTGKLGDDEIAQLVHEMFDLRPRAIIEMLDLRRPIYEPLLCVQQRACKAAARKRGASVPRRSDRQR